MNISRWSRSHGLAVQARLERLVDEASGEDAAHSWRCEIAERFGLLTCVSAPGIVVAVNSEGNLYSIGEGHASGPFDLAPTDEWFWVAVEKLTREPEFADLRPFKPADADSCEMCDGAGEIVVGSAHLRCGTCLGFGWHGRQDMVQALASQLNATG